MNGVIQSSYHIPEERVENDGNNSITKAGVMKVDVIKEFFHWCHVHLKETTT